MAIHSKLIGDPKEVSMEARIFHEVSLITILSLIISLGVSFIIEIPYVTLILALTLLLNIGLYINARFYKNLQSSAAIFCITLNLILVLNFFVNSGIKGPTLLLLMVSFFFSLTIMPKKHYLFWIPFNIFSVATLLLTEYLYPSLIRNSYFNRSDVFFDTGFTYIVCVACIFIILFYIVKNLVNEKNKFIAVSKDLEKANESKTKLLSILSHDLRSPLNSIQSFLELLLAYDLDANEKKVIKERLLKETKNTQIMLYNMLSWTKSQMEGGMKVDLTSVSLHNELKVVLEILEISALEKVITITNKIDAKLCLTADVEMIKLVIRNLINNAIKFTPSGGNITLSSYVKNSYVTLIIEDDGIGISEEKQKQIFSIAAETTYGTNNEKGVGLGLLLCKEFTELQGGTIKFESTLGKGSKFSLTFPLCPSSNLHAGEPTNALTHTIESHSLSN